MRPPTIYIPQRPRPEYMEDIMNKAVKYGEIKIVLAGGQLVDDDDNFDLGLPDKWKLRASDAVEQLTQALSDFRRDDYILALGDPAVIGLTFAIAAQQTDGHVQVLKWDRQTKSYFPVRIFIQQRRKG